jgi:hypothetical protein
LPPGGEFVEGEQDPGDELPDQVPAEETPYLTDEEAATLKEDD